MINRLALLALLCLACPAAAQEVTPDRATAATTRLAEAELALLAAQAQPDATIALTGAIRLFEDGLIVARADVQAAEAVLDDLKAPLTARQDQISRLLGAAVLWRHRSGTLDVARPDGSRAALLYTRFGSALDADMAGLADAYAKVAAAQARLDTASATLTDGQSVHDAALDDLRRAMQATTLPERFTPDPVQTALLLAETTSLADLTGRLATVYDLGLPNDAVLAAKGALPAPVTGRVLHAFGTTDPTGVARGGTILATPPDALVVSPTAATILFAASVDPLGEVVIISPSAGVLVTFAGLAEAFVEPGKIIPGGIPLGLMGGDPPPVDANFTALTTPASGGESQALYLAVREGQTPVDPATWFALENEMDKQ